KSLYYYGSFIGWFISSHLESNVTCNHYSAYNGRISFNGKYGTMGNDDFYVSEWNYDSNHCFFNGNFYNASFVFIFDVYIYCWYSNLLSFDKFSDTDGWPCYSSGRCWNYDAIN